MQKNAKYIANHRFGMRLNDKGFYEYIDFDKFIEKTLKMMGSGNTYLYNRQLFAEAYETEYKIFDHRAAVNPLAPVSFQEAEIYLPNNSYQRHLEFFIAHEVGKKMGMSFDDFLDRTPGEIDQIKRVVEKISAMRHEDDKKTQEELKRLQGLGDKSK